MNDSLQLFASELSIVTKPIPKLSNPEDVLIKVAYSGVCGTDLHIISGEFPASAKALTLGHEFCGTIENVGKSVTEFKPGDRVVIDPNQQCYLCRYCRSGQPQFCVKGRTETSIGVFKNGGWANYCRVPVKLVYKLPANFPMSNGIFIEPMSCILRGWKQLGEIAPYKQILICGAGIIGLLWACFLHFKGYRCVTLSEVSEVRRDIASNMKVGYRVVEPLTLENECAKAKEEEDFYWGFDVIIDCTGSPKALQQSFEWTRFGAKMLCFGVAPQDAKIEIDPFLMYFKEVSIIGSLINPFTFEPSISVVENMKDYLSYELLGIKSYTLQDYPSALGDLKQALSSKAVFKLDISIQ